MKYKKIKPKKRKFKDNKLLLLLLLLSCIGIGYASLTTSLSITGTTNVATNSWNIHFANIAIRDDSVSGNPAASIQSGNMSITYGGELTHPGDFYEFSVDVVNDGTLPGKVSIVNLTGNSTNYLSTSYSYANGDTINVGDIINAGSFRRLTIKTWIPEDIDTSLLPTTDTAVTLTFNLQYIQSEVDLPTDLKDTIIKLADNNTCINKFDDQITDQVGTTNVANHVYYDNCEDKRNIIYHGICWQVIRTTETGGTKVIYNGEAENGKCLSTRNDHLGFVGTERVTQSLNADYLYGTSFSYDLNTRTFTLTGDLTTQKMSATTKEGLIGQYTCLSDSNTCTTLTVVGGAYSNSIAFTTTYTIDNTHYSQIGTSTFNAYDRNPAIVGYMYNKVYYGIVNDPGTNEYLFANSFTYNNSTNTYTLSGTTKTITNWEEESQHIENTHYTCWNTTGTCEKISYVYFTNTPTAPMYIELENGKCAEDALTEMLYDDNVNVRNSIVKATIDTWYRQNLSTANLYDSIFCGTREIKDLGGWDPNGGDTSVNYSIKFVSQNNNNNLTCPNITDQYSILNNKAKLTYPVALLQREEARHISTNTLRNTGNVYWLMEPATYLFFYAYNSSINDTGALASKYTSGNIGVRPVVAIPPNVGITGGNGSEDSPWTLQE